MNDITAIIWFSVGIFMGACNDVWIKLLSRIPSVEISCGRMFFATICIIPLILANKSIIKTKRYSTHLLRSAIFSCAITLWGMGIKNTPLSTATIISFSEPFFVLIMSRLIINEKPTIYRMLSTIINFIIILAIIDVKFISLKSGSIVLLFSSFFLL